MSLDNTSHPASNFPFLQKDHDQNSLGSVVLALRPTVCTSLGPS